VAEPKDLEEPTGVSARMGVVEPQPSHRIASAARFTQFRMAWADGSNSRASSSGVRLRRTNTGGYGRCGRSV